VDNVAHVYQMTLTSEENELNTVISEHIQLQEKIQTYITETSEEIVKLLSSEKNREWNHGDF